MLLIGHSLRRESGRRRWFLKHTLSSVSSPTTSSASNSIQNLESEAQLHKHSEKNGLAATNCTWKICAASHCSLLELRTNKWKWKSHSFIHQKMWSASHPIGRVAVCNCANSLFFKQQFTFHFFPAAGNCRCCFTLSLCRIAAITFTTHSLQTLLLFLFNSLQLNLQLLQKVELLQRALAEMKYNISRLLSLENRDKMTKPVELWKKLCVLLLVLDLTFLSQCLPMRQNYAHFLAMHLLCVCALHIWSKKSDANVMAMAINFSVISISPFTFSRPFGCVFFLFLLSQFEFIMFHTIHTSFVSNQKPINQFNQLNY